jgi:hypothetical protein
MAKTLSADLRSRLIAAVEGGMSRRAASAHFKVGVAIAIRVIREFRWSSWPICATASTVWRFLDRHDITFKENRARQRAGAV